MGKRRDTFSLGEVAKVCGVTRNTVRNWVKRGSLTAYALPGGHFRVSQANLTTFMREYGIPTDRERLSGAPAAVPISVLVIDDDPVLGKLFETALGRQGGSFEVRLASNGTEGLLLAGSMAPDVVVLDVLMPGLSGADVCRSMRQMASLAETIIVVMSGYPDADETKEAIKVGAHAFLAKPVSPSVLVETILRLTSRKGSGS